MKPTVIFATGLAILMLLLNQPAMNDWFFCAVIMAFAVGLPYLTLLTIREERRARAQMPTIVSELLLRLHGEERERNCAFKYLEARSRNLVNHHWREIQDLAKALLERRALNGQEVKKVLSGSRQT